VRAAGLAAVLPMNTSARTPVREARLLSQAAQRAFTLIELLTVIAIIAILSGISLKVIKGVKERSYIGQAKAELAALSQALEMYKLQYGDYPQVGTGTWSGATTNETKLLQALIGKFGPVGATITGKSFIETSKFTTSGDPYSVATATLQDPWGNNYYYLYKSPGWTAPSYILLSVGPDGYSYGTTLAPSANSAIINADGTFATTAQTDSGALDNIYANK
jgi:prepilin-type N-terminal cleavage/methylation domain-containing protein